MTDNDQDPTARPPDPAPDSASDSASDQAPETPRAGSAGARVADASSPPAGAAVAAAPRRSGGGLLWALLVLLIVAGAAAAGYYYGKPMLDARDARLNALETELQALRRLADGERARTGDLQVSQQRAATDIARFGERLDAQDHAIGELRENVDGGRLRVQLAVVEQLLMLANDRVLVSREIDPAVTALEAADARLATLKDPRLFAVREAIAQERAALQAVRQPDIVGASLMLSGLIDRVPQLPLAAEVPAQFSATPSAPEALPVDAPAWRRAWAAIRQAVASAFTVRRDAGPAPQLLGVEQSAMVQQMLALRLEAARLALLRRDAASLRDLCAAAARWLDDYYRSDDAAVAAVRADLQQLQALDLAPPLPDISRSLSLLRGFSESPAP